MKSSPAAQKPWIGNRRRGLLLASLTALIWGTVPLAGEVALAGISAPALSALRLFVGALFLALFLSRKRGEARRLFRRPPKLVYVAAFGLAGNYVGYMLGLERAGAAASQVLIQVAPLFLIVLSILFLGERPTLRHLAGAALALVGCVLVSLGRQSGGLGGSRTLGFLFIVFAALTWAIYATAHKSMAKEHSSGRTTMWIFLVAAVFASPVAALRPLGHLDWVEGCAIAYLCMNTVVAYWSFGESLRHVEASVVAVVTTMGPAVTFALLAVFNHVGWSRIPHEDITAGRLVGAALVLAGVSAAVTARPRKT